VRNRICSCAVAIAATVLLFAVGSRASAQSLFDFDEWMDTVDKKSQSVQLNLTARNADAASADAREIGELYGSMEDFFSRRGGSDNAVKLSRQGRELAANVVSSVAAKDFATASNAAVTLAQACRTCHLQYKPLE
jgi:hypothetical protein